ncbi:MAG: HAMP domain-containing histidine kinase [Rhodocyclaceae bacterium]|nr:HAMP domain-containing histidine kinase [Rhodocyclaceae bacterium]
MKGTLFGRVAVVLTGMVAVLAAVMLHVAGQRERWHADQVQQTLHRALASHMVDDNPLLRHGEIAAASLDNAFHALMLLGPAFEIYATDLDGQVRAYSADPGQVREMRVDLAPVRDFLAGRPLPIYGTDPRDPTRRQVFSAAPILDPDGARRGYLYVIVGGSRQSAVERQHEAGLWQDRALLFSLGAVGVVALLSGLLFALLTRPLAALNRAMAAFRTGGLSREAIGRQLPGWASREVAELQQGFVGLAETVADQLDQIRASETARRDLIAQIAHDLKTPLASLQGYLETWLLQHPDAPDRQHVEVALRNGRQLHRLVEQLLELARLEARQEQAEIEPVAVLELAHDVAARFALAARRRGVRLEVTGDDEVLAEADIGKLERVLVNLVDNALDHTPAGGEVRIGVHCEDDAVRLEVRDTGCGIAADHQARIFEPRYRARDGGGGSPHLGLGLAIVERLLALHGSAIRVDSAPGRGAAFSFGLARVGEGSGA